MDESLRSDVRLLGEILGDVIKAAEGPQLFMKVEEVRALAKTARAGTPDATKRLEQLLHGVDAATALPLTRAFAHFLALANVAEMAHRARNLHAAEALAAPLVDKLGKLHAAGVTPEAITAAVRSMEIELVLTAHPTQAARRTLIEKFRRVSVALAERHAPDADEQRVVAALRSEITAIWHTDELRRKRPTPVDEARAGLVLFEQVVWDALPDALRRLDEALVRTTGSGLPVECTPVRFGSWMGGDRDGNPGVTAAVTEEVLWLSRWQAADLYLRELRPLRDELSMHRASEELRAFVSPAREPYRAMIDRLVARLGITRRLCEEKLAKLRGAPLKDRPDPSAFGGKAPAGTPNGTPTPICTAAELAAPLAVLHRSLHTIGAGAVADGRLLDLRRRVAAFGLTLARLDIRQEASVHTKALDALTRSLDLGSYAEWDEARRQAWVLGELRSRRPLVPRDIAAAPELTELLATLKVVAAHPPECFGAYVISMASQPSDVLAVHLLQKEAGVKQPLPVAPLFETHDDLRRAGQNVAALLDAPGYRQIAGDRQQVMIGYSDSTKDAGRLPSAWALYKTQEEVLDACRSRGVQLTFFHGRGGTISRGGGPVHLAVLSQPPGSIEGRLRVTIQGEAIDSSFALHDIAVDSLEVYIGAVLEATLAPPPPPRASWRARMDELAESALGAYRSVRDEPGFPEYFRQATPEPELALLRIGSRPVRRPGGQAGLASLRAIPWVFAWTQCRLMITAWLGTESALARGLAGPAAEEVREMAQEWPFLRAFLDLTEMVLAKADPSVAAVYERLLVPPQSRGAGEKLRALFAQCQKEVLEVRRHAGLLEGDPALAQSIALRNPYVDPLNLLQAELLRRLRSGQAGEDGNLAALEDALLITINGIAAGMRNTG